MRRDALLRYRADRLMRKDFQGLQPRVLAAVGARLRAVGASLDRADLDACYSAAWHGLYAALADGAQIDDVTAWLVLVTFRRAVDECRALARQRAVGEAQATLALATGSSAPARSGEIADELDRRDRLRQLIEGFASRLSPRERRAATLCYLHGLPRAQAARRMGISQARMRKLMDGSPGRAGVAAKVSDLLQSVGASEWCEQQGSLIRAHALGILDPEGERQELAREHLRHCPACRAMVLALRGLAAALPPVAALPGPPAPGAARGRGLTRLRVATRPPMLAGITPMGGSLATKIAVVGVAMVIAGGGYALLALGAAGHTRVRSRPTSAISLGSLPVPRAVGNPPRSPVAYRRAHPEEHLRHLRQPFVPAHSMVAGRPVSASPSPTSAPAVRGAAPSTPLRQARWPSGEFTPERVGGGSRSG
jgi:RNA polymerase sigma factor (sigma-70 family)